MALAIAVPVRQVVLRRWRHGQNASDIAAALGLAPRSVRRLIHRFRQGCVDADSLGPAYVRCGWRRPWPEPRLFEHALDLRREHPAWGATLIQVFLSERWPKQPLPSERTLQRWFHDAGLGPAPRGRRPELLRHRANQPHEVWQMDAVEKLRLQHGHQACWLRLTDEFTGAMLHTKVFPMGAWSQVGASAVQAQLRQAFARWGRPQRLRVDNGTPWGSAGDLPTPLALWILGLDVALTWNRPRRPRDNAVVERTQGVSERWVEAHTCADANELQRRLNRLDRVQRERYPSIAGQSRTQAYPQLTHSGRTYSRPWEKRHWQRQRVLDNLSEYVVVRQVDHSGKIWLYDRPHWIGKSRIGDKVYVTLDAETAEWVVQNAQGQELRRQPARQLTTNCIRNLRVGRIGRHD